MDNTTSPSQGSRKINPADKLKSRLFEKGIGHSSMSSFKSPLSTDYANRMLLVNLNSSKYERFLCLVLRSFPPRYWGSRLQVCLTKAHWLCRKKQRKVPKKQKELRRPVMTNSGAKKANFYKNFRPKRRKTWRIRLPLIFITQ